METENSSVWLDSLSFGFSGFCWDKNLTPTCVCAPRYNGPPHQAAGRAAGPPGACLRPGTCCRTAEPQPNRRCGARGGQLLRRPPREAHAPGPLARAQVRMPRCAQRAILHLFREAGHRQQQPLPRRPSPRHPSHALATLLPEMFAGMPPPPTAWWRPSPPPTTRSAPSTTTWRTASPSTQT